MTEILKVAKRDHPRSMLIGLGMVILTLLLLGIGNMMILRHSDEETQLLYQSELMPVSHIKEANAKLFDIERNLKRVIIAQSPGMRSEARTEIASGEKILQEEIAQAKTSISSPENLARITAIEELYGEYRNNVARALRMMESDNIHGDNPIEYVLSEDFQQVIRSTDRLLDEIAASKIDIARARVESARLSLERTLMVSLLILVATLIGGIVAIRYFISHLLPSEAGQTIEPRERPSPDILPKRPVVFGSQTSPLCRCSHDYMAALGESLYLQGELVEAEKFLRSALVLIPHSTPALQHLAGILYGRGLFREAETCLRRLLRINPHLEHALYLLSLTLASTGRAEDAEACQRKLLTINPSHEGALLLMKHFLAQTGEFKQAETVVRRALAINPRSATALVEFGNLRKMTPADADWMNAAEESVKMTLPADEFQLRYAMGKYCDDVKDFDRAFANYHRANQLSKAIAGNPYIPDDWTRSVDRLIQSNGQARAGRALPGSSASQRPVFIVGMPRSGTSLVEQIMASHPAVFGAGELPYWGRASRLRPGCLFDPALNEGLLNELATGYLGYLANLNDGAARVIDKMPDNFFYLGLIHAVFPNAKFIHTKRNPIDTCLSIYFQNFSSSYKYARDLNDLAHYYREYRRLMAHWQAILPERTMLELQYEDLLADQEGSSRNLIEFIGLAWDQRCLNYQDTKRRVATASKWQVRQKLYSSSVERWRNYEKFIGPLMALQDLQH